MSSVTVSITNGASASVPWAAGMTARQALEAAYNQNPSQFAFGIQYYGAFGYLAFMFNETCDTWNTGAQPYYYWEFFLNGAPANHGIDTTVLNAGDAISFAFTTYTSAKKNHPQALAKRRGQS